MLIHHLEENLLKITDLKLDADVLQVKFFLYFLCGHLQQWMVNVDKYFV